MSTSFTSSTTTAFTLTHARELASKIATDLKRVQRFYDSPTTSRIACFEAEAIALLKGGYLKEVTYGFQRNRNWIEPTLRYTAQDLNGMLGVDDDPGRVQPGKDISEAVFRSFLEYTPAWHALSTAEQQTFEQGLPFQRSEVVTPGVTGILVPDLTYSAGGRALSRTTVKTY